jgi:hypothetical protein
MSDHKQIINSDERVVEIIEQIESLMDMRQQMFETDIYEDTMILTIREALSVIKLYSQEKTR